MKRKIIGIIPARYKSSRFPGKPLALLLNKPMVIWVLELTSKVLGKENTYVATDDSRIANIVKEYGYQYIMTSERHLTGTDRLAEVAERIEAEIYLNIQGDEPVLDPKSILKIIDAKVTYEYDVINGMSRINEDENVDSVNIPKVVFNEQKKMIYMSRLPIPGCKDIGNRPAFYYKQVCIYAFNRNHLLSYGHNKRKGIVETYEDIEILRFLELDIPVRMIELEDQTYAVDIEEDIPRVEKKLKEIHGID